MQSRVIVLDYGKPHQRLLAWFLSDSGIPNERVTAVAEAIEMARGGMPAIVIVNTAEPLEDVAQAVAEIRESAPPPRVIVVHEAEHTADLPELDADLCIHDVHDVDDLVKLVRAALNGNVPDEEPHEAAEEIVDEPLAG